MPGFRLPLPPARTIPLRALLALGATLAALLALAAPASASLLATTVSSASTAQRECAARPASPGAAGVVSRQVAAPAGGIVSAKLAAASGDWDLAVFDAAGRTVGASAGFNAVEVAEGFVGRATTLTVQACRLAGSSGSAKVDVAFAPVPTGAGDQKAQLVEVKTPTPFHENLLNAIGVDVTEHGGPGYVGAVLYGDEDVDKLRKAGLEYEVKTPDLAARSRENARQDIAFAAATDRSPLPSGVDAYRHLWEYEYALKELARRYPDLVRPITLPNRTNEGRQVHGVEITKDAANWRDGKPVYVQMGVHHAREWPSGENAIEFAFDLAMNYGRSARITSLVDRVRTVVVPIVNPDGFNLSREAPVDLRDVTGTEGDAYAVMSLSEPFFAYKRRNCRPVDGQPSPPGVCGLQPFRYTGVDPNRNYGGFWGGPGASSLPAYDTYRGPGPFSEPETQNIRDLVSKRQVTTLITNHTFTGLVLRPPGLRAQGPSPDEGIYKALGDRMSEQNGYTSQFGYDLYDTTGTTEDWSYYATGGLGYTFEIGFNEFHPPFAETIGEYVGAGAYAGKGNREAFLLAMENAADASKHSVIEGSVPPGALLRLRKAFVTETSNVRTVSTGLLNIPEVEEDPANQGAKIRFLDVLDTWMKVPASGSGAFEWHVNPSTRPILAEKRIPGVAESPYRTETWENSEVVLPGEHIDKELSITDENTRLLKVTLDWATPDDWDLEIYLKRPDGSLQEMPGSAGPPGAKEVAFIDDPPVGDYILRVVNFSAANPAWTLKAELFEPGPDVVTGGGKEAWKLTCHWAGKAKTQKVYVDRGQRVTAEAPCP